MRNLFRNIWTIRQDPVGRNTCCEMKEAIAPFYLKDGGACLSLSLFPSFSHFSLADSFFFLKFFSALISSSFFFSSSFYRNPFIADAPAFSSSPSTRFSLTIRHFSFAHSNTIIGKTKRRM